MQRSLKAPPLRERREEIPPLIDHYLRKFADEQNKGRLSLDDETLEYIARANAFLLRGVAMTVKATCDVQRSKELGLL